MLSKLFKPKPRRRHRVAHRAAHRWEPCEIGGVVEMLRSENVRDDDVVEKAGDSFPRVGRGSIQALFLSRASLHTDRHVGRQRGGSRVRVFVRRCVSRLPRKTLFCLGNAKESSADFCSQVPKPRLILHDPKSGRAASGCDGHDRCAAARHRGRVR
jgi:hypothetical protein